MIRMLGASCGGEQFLDAIPMRFRRAILDKHITRLVKNDNGGPTFESINNVADVIKLAGRGGAFDLEKEFGIPADRVAAFDRAARLAIAVGIDALRDAGIPLVMRYKTTSKNTQLPERWGLPDALRDDTGCDFCLACFPALTPTRKRYRTITRTAPAASSWPCCESLRDRVNGRKWPVPS